MSNDLPPLQRSDRYTELEESDQKIVVVGLARLLETKKLDTVRRVCELGNPVIIRGIQYDKSYTNIANESLEVMRVLLRQYL